MEVPIPYIRPIFQAYVSEYPHSSYGLFFGTVLWEWLVWAVETVSPRSLSKDFSGPSEPWCTTENGNTWLITFYIILLHFITFYYTLLHFITFHYILYHFITFYYMLLQSNSCTQISLENPIIVECVVTIPIGSTLSRCSTGQIPIFLGDSPVCVGCKTAVMVMVNSTTPGKNLIFAA